MPKAQEAICSIVRKIASDVVSIKEQQREISTDGHINSFLCQDTSSFTISFRVLFLFW